MQAPFRNDAITWSALPSWVWSTAIVGSVALGVIAVLLPLVYVVAILAGLVIIALVFWQPAIGASVYVFMVYSRLLEYIPQLQEFRIMLLLSGLLAASIFLRNVLTGERWWFGGVLNKVMFIAAAALASVPLAIWKSNSLSEATEFLKVIVAILLIANSIKTERQLLWFTRLLVLGFTWLSGTVVWNYFTGNVGLEGGGEVVRAHGAGSTLGDSNEVMAFVLMLAPLALFGIRYEPSRFLRVIYVLSTPVGLAALIYSGSRGGFLGFLWLLLLLFIRSRRKMIFIIVSCAVFIAVWFAAPPAWRDRMLSIKDYKQDESATIRTQLWQAARGMVQHNPVTGIGIGNFSDFAQNYGAGVDMVAHNTYYLFMGEQGLLGLVAYLLYLLHIWRTGRRWEKETERSAVQRWLGAGLSWGYLVFLVPSYFVALSYYTHTYIPAAVLAAGECIYTSKRKTLVEGREG